MNNIILIGMPGCGKSTVAKALGQMTDRPVYDSDEEITRRTGSTPAVILAEKGDAEFRRIESEIIKDLCRAENAVISTGGGVVTIDGNYAPLRESGIVIWLKKDLSLLSDADRPLLQKRGAEALYREREPLYRRFSHLSVDSASCPDITARLIIEAINGLAR